NEKDALDTNDAPLYELVREFRSRPKWVGVATELRTRLGLKLRSEIAGTATTRLQGTEFCRGTLLVIVDETQDLVHGEWKALIDWCAARCRGGAATRLTLIGDENQRISPTSFSWAEVKRHCADAFQAEGWTEDPDSRADVLPPRAIKGLEFGSLVVVEPLGGRGAHLSYGEATVAYTSLTRAIEDLLCVLTPAEWSVVRGRWAGL